MSRHRINPEAGWRRPTGKCRQCGHELPPGRTFCSAKDRDCVHQWKLKSQPGYVRACLKKRDHEICSSCGLDCRALQDAVHEFVYGGPCEPPKRYDYYLDHDRRVADYRTTQLKKQWLRDVDLTFDRSPWEAHHATPVVLGGGECGIEGYTTLCRWCHARGTAVLAEIRKYQRKVVGS